MRALMILALAMGLAGCTMSQEVKNQCSAMGFEPGSDKMAECQMRLTEAAIQSPKYGGGAPIAPPPVNFQPMPAPQSYGKPTLKVQANCTTYQTGIYANTNCF